MKTYKQSILAIVIGLALAAGISFAETTWIGPTDNPPDDNTPAPINVGAGTQYKSGALGVGGLFQADSASTFAGLATFSTMKITSGAGAGKVLTSDSSGNASWKSLGALPVTSGGGIPDNMRIFDSNGTWVVPDGVTKIMIEAWGGGGGGSGSGISDGNIGGGGGGGGYTKKIVRVSGGDTVNITIGGGGSGGAIKSDGFGGGSTEVKIGSNIVAKSHGGSGGKYDISSYIVRNVVFYNVYDPGGVGGGADDLGPNDIRLTGEDGTFIGGMAAGGGGSGGTSMVSLPNNKIGKEPGGGGGGGLKFPAGYGVSEKAEGGGYGAKGRVVIYY